MSSTLTSSRVNKMSYIGTRQARRILPGMMVRVDHVGVDGKVYQTKSLVEASHLYQNEHMILVLEDGSRVKCKWGDRFDAWTNGGE